MKKEFEIGFDFNYSENDEHDLGYMWVTAPFDWDEIEPYKTDHKFWEYASKNKLKVTIERIL